MLKRTEETFVLDETREVMVSKETWSDKRRPAVVGHQNGSYGEAGLVYHESNQDDAGLDHREGDLIEAGLVCRSRSPRECL